MRKTNTITKLIAITVMATILAFGSNRMNFTSEKMVINERILTDSNKEIITIKANALIRDVEEKLEITAETKIKEEPVLVYDNLTMEELIDKLNRTMKSTLTGKGELFASHALTSGVDPYIALAIVYQETGCYYGNCSAMVQQCNNIGGMKGGSSRCWGGSYAAYSTIDEGIINFINNLAVGYFNQGLTTPELMNRKYAEDTLWASRVNNYVNIIKNS